MWDVAIIGAGPAGLSAALILGRCRRRVLVFDHGQPRNAASHGLHGFLSRDGIPPAEFLRVSRAQLAAYDSVVLRTGEVVGAQGGADGFALVEAGGAQETARKLLLATGVVDVLPDIDGLRDCYGRSVHHCPYCDGWEWRDRPVAVYGRGPSGLKAALALTAWTGDVVLCTDGPPGFAARGAEQLDRLGVRLRTERIARLDATDGWLRAVAFADGPPLPRSALFFETACPQRSGLAAALGCATDDRGAPRAGAHGRTNVPGLYLAGDASRDVQLAVVAAAEGAAAAVHINTALTRTRLEAPRPERDGPPGARRRT